MKKRFREDYLRTNVAWQKICKARREQYKSCRNYGWTALEAWRRANARINELFKYELENIKADLAGINKTIDDVVFGRGHFYANPTFSEVPRMFGINLDGSLRKIT